MLGSVYRDNEYNDYVYHKHIPSLNSHLLFNTIMHKTVVVSEEMFKEFNLIKSSEDITEANTDYYLGSVRYKDYMDSLTVIDKDLYEELLSTDSPEDFRNSINEHLESGTENYLSIKLGLYIKEELDTLISEKEELLKDKALWLSSNKYLSEMSISEKELKEIELKLLYCNNAMVFV